MNRHTAQTTVVKLHVSHLKNSIIVVTLHIIILILYKLWFKPDYLYIRSTQNHVFV